VLASTIDANMSQYMGLAEQALKKISFYISPEIYKAEEEFAATGKLPGERRNVDFEMHSNSAAETGTPKMRMGMQKMIDKIFKQPRDPADTTVLQGEDAVPVVVPAMHTPRDPGELGD